MSYQGFLTDATGGALGASAPKNYDVIFRVWNDQSAGVRLWAEQQTVTVDKGYFSVILGEGAPAGGEPHPSLASIFAGPDVSERYVEVTVKGIGNGGVDVTILPRLKLLSSPYAFLATSANSLVSPNGSTLVSSANGQLVVNGKVSGDGSGLTNLNADQIASGTLPGARLNGTYPNALVLNNSGNSFAGNGAGLTALNGANISTGTLADARLSGNVALRGSINTFTVNQIFNGNVGIGASSPSAPLNIFSSSILTALFDGSSPNGTELSLRNTSSGGLTWNLVSAGSGTSGGAGRLLITETTTSRNPLSIGTTSITVNSNLTVTGNLDVNGALTSGANKYAAGAENLKILRGRIGFSGNILSGSGFTISLSGASYVINFGSAFPDVPAVTVTPEANVLIPVITSASASSVTVSFRNPAVTSVAVPSQFQFIAVGSR